MDLTHQPVNCHPVNSCDTWDVSLATFVLPLGVWQFGGGSQPRWTRGLAGEAEPGAGHVAAASGGAQGALRGSSCDPGRACSHGECLFCFVLMYGAWLVFWGTHQNWVNTILVPPKSRPQKSSMESSWNPWDHGAHGFPISVANSSISSFPIQRKLNSIPVLKGVCWTNKGFRKHPRRDAGSSTLHGLVFLANGFSCFFAVPLNKHRKKEFPYVIYPPKSGKGFLLN